MTNERICAIIADGDADELIPILWGKVNNTYRMLSTRLYHSYKNQAERMGVELEDCIQVGYLAFLDALGEYNKAPQTVKFVTFAKFRVKSRVFELLGFNKRRTYEALNAVQSIDVPSNVDMPPFSETIADKATQVEFYRLEYDDYVQYARRVINAALEVLSPEQRQAVNYLYFGIPPAKPTAKGVYYSQLYSALSRLRRCSHSKKLKEVLEGFYDFENLSVYHGTSLTAFKNTGTSSVERIALSAISTKERIDYT